MLIFLFDFFPSIQKSDTTSPPSLDSLIHFIFIFSKYPVPTHAVTSASSPALPPSHQPPQVSLVRPPSPARRSHHASLTVIHSFGDSHLFLPLRTVTWPQIPLGTMELGSNLHTRCVTLSHHLPSLRLTGANSIYCMGPW